MKIIEFFWRLPPPPPIKNPTFLWGFLFIRFFLWRCSVFLWILSIYIKTKKVKTRKKELTICSNPSCGIEFLKDLSEINRNKKIDRKNYCSRKCSGINNHSHLSEFSGNYEYLKPFIKNRSDEYTGIREHFRLSLIHI